MRIARCHRRLEADTLKQFADPQRDVAIVVQNAMGANRLGYRITNGLARIQRRKGILKDVLHIAAQALPLAAAHCRHQLSAEPHLTRNRVLKLPDSPADGGFSRARFTDKRQCFPGVYVKADMVDRTASVRRPAKEVFPDVETYPQIAHLKQWHAGITRRILITCFADKPWLVAIQDREGFAQRQRPASHRTEARHS